MKTYTPYVIGLLAVLCATCGYEQLSDKPALCDDQYALCTSAKCIPDPNNADKTICFCDVARGKNYGQESCKNRIPYKDKEGVTHLVSTYSFGQYASKKTMTCPSGNLWSYCLDKPCTIDPTNPEKAICSCELEKTGDFVTLGGDCDKSTCKDSYWSAAAPDATAAAMKILAKSLGLNKGPENYCPE